jgi:hypothetical protein
LQNGGFTAVPVYEGQVVLMREITLKYVSDATDVFYTRLKQWVKDNYSGDIFSTITYYDKDASVVVKSKVELLLPLMNEQNIGEKAVMSFHLYAFTKRGICTVQFSNIGYRLKETIPPLSKKLKAEEFITDEAIRINDWYSKERATVRKSTLYYFNELTKKLEMALNGETSNISDIR